LATEALELEQSGLSYQRVPPGYRFPYGPGIGAWRKPSEPQHGESI